MKRFKNTIICVISDSHSNQVPPRHIPKLEVKLITSCVLVSQEAKHGCCHLFYYRKSSKYTILNFSFREIWPDLSLK